MNIQTRLEKLEAATQDKDKGDVTISWEEFVRRAQAGDPCDGTSWGEFVKILCIETESKTSWHPPARDKSTRPLVKVGGFVG